MKNHLHITPLTHPEQLGRAQIISTAHLCRVRVLLFLGLSFHSLFNTFMVDSSSVEDKPSEN
uniref:Uncharacterized protein n=1 Tax=Glossina austeni TaxID=7395 RepID=A0A1A9V175_GLOAU